MHDLGERGATFNLCVCMAVCASLSLSVSIICQRAWNTVYVAPVASSARDAPERDCALFDREWYFFRLYFVESV